MTTPQASPLVVFDGQPHTFFREENDWGQRVLELAAPPRRLWGSQPSYPAPVRTQIDPYQTTAYPLPGQLLSNPLADGDTWSALTRRSLTRFEAFFLATEDPQRRLDAREVVTLAHQVSLVRHILDDPSRRRVLIGDEVGLGKTVVAGLIIQELLAANPGLRVLYLAPARLVSNVGREFKRLELLFRQWKSQDGDARLDTDSRIIASIHRAVHPNHIDQLKNGRPWDLIVVDECHHLSAWSPEGGDPVLKYGLVKDLIDAQTTEGRLLLMSGTPHQAHADRFNNLLRLLRTSDEPESAAAGRVIYRTKEDVRDWEGRPLFPRRQVNPPIIVDLGPMHQMWLTAIHHFFKPPLSSRSHAVQRAAGWKCAQALQWAASSPNAGLGYLVRQALRSGWTLADAPLSEAIGALRPYRSGTRDESIDSIFHRLQTEIQRQAEDDDIEDIEEDLDRRDADVNHADLANLITVGIRLVQSQEQPKWERLWHDVLQPAGRDKIVMFAQPIETVLALVNWLEVRTGQRPAIIIGEQTEAERDRQVARFRDPNGTQFMVSSRAGGEGINLQFSHRLVHLDVPWNPMEMEQRVGRVHRFGSRETIQVDTMVVRDSRETQAWNVARERLRSVAQTMVAPDRFETVFSRVMCLIPPEELQTVLINSPTVPLDEAEIQRLSALVESGFQEWRAFHDRYAANQNQIREQNPGLATWAHLRDFLTRNGNARPAEGVARTRFTLREGQAQAVDEAAEVIRLADGTLRLVGDYDGGMFSGTAPGQVGPLGLNVAAVADLLRNCACASLPAGAAHLRWGEAHKDLRARYGDEVVLLAFVRQAFHLNSVGGITDGGTELMAYAVSAEDTRLLEPHDRSALFGLAESATIRLRPAETALFARAAGEEMRMYAELRRPMPEEVRQGLRYAVWPILAAHMSV